VHFNLENKSDECSKIHTVKITIPTIQYSIFKKIKPLLSEGKGLNDKYR
jgi:hypothetical protein